MVALTSLLALISTTTSLVQAIPVERNNDKSDACQRMIGNIAAYKPSTVLACLKSIPFSEQVRQNVMGTVTAMYGISIFQYNQLGDDEPALNQGIDVIKEFARINSSTYNSDYEFQSDLSQVMYSLNDGHHAWVNCYQTAFGTSHYIPIVAIGDGASEKASIYIAPDVETFVAASGVGQFYGSLGIDPTLLAGAKVLKVEGKDVWEYLDNVAIPGAGTYQDPEQRLTSLFSGYSASGFGGAIARQPGGFTVAQDFTKDNITLGIQLASGEKGDVTIPWLTQWLGSRPFQYPTGVDLFNGICTFSDNDTPPPVAGNTTETGTNTTDPTTTQQPAEGSETANSTMTIDEAAQALYASCPVENFARYQLADQYNPLLSTSYLGGRDIQFYTLRNDSSVGVMYVPTFSPEGNNTVACRNRYVYDAYLGLRNLTQAGVTKLLIDTSNNGGGNIALTQWLQRLITGEKYLSYVNFQSLLRKAPLSEALVDAHIANPDAESGSFSPSYFRNGGNGSLVDLSNSTDFFEPGQQRNINGQTLYTSNPISDSLDNIVEYDETFNLSDEAPFPPMDVVFTGNGLCGSSCSSFTNFLIEYYNATAYVSAARPANDIEFQSFAAGQVTTSGNLYEEAKAVGLNDTTLLPELIIRGTFSFALRAALSPNIAPGEFLQYRRFPAQNRYSLTFDQYNDIIGNWEYVASKVFNKA